MSRFCCFSMTNPYPKEASQSECKYFDTVGFRDLYLGVDGKTWCALHAPNEFRLAPTAAEMPHQAEIFFRLSRFVQRHLISDLDLRRTYWRSKFIWDDLDLTEFLNQAE
jgi:hypothetical protein